MIHFDGYSTEAKRGSYAKKFIWVDFSKPLLQSIIIEEKKLYIQYEGLNDFCKECFLVKGHSSDCTLML